MNTSSRTRKHFIRVLKLEWQSCTEHGWKTLSERLDYSLILKKFEIHFARTVYERITDVSSEEFRKTLAR